MPVLKRNHRAVAAAKPHPDKRIRYRIEGVAGLWLDVTPSGKRTWYTRYQRQIGKSRTFRWYRIGDATTVGLAQATDRARQIIAEVLIDGRDPHQERLERKLTTATFADLFEAWHERHAQPRLARARLDRCIYDCHLRDSIAQTAISELRRTHVGLLRDHIAKSSGPIASDNALTLINRVLNWAVDEGLVEYNPASRLRKAGNSRPRERVLTAQEIRTFWLAIDRMDELSGSHIARGESGRILSAATRTTLRLMLLTGQRRGEVSQTEKSELELDGPEPIWAIPGVRTKNGLLHRVPLCDTAADLFRDALATSPPASAYVFASPAQPDLPISPNAVTRAMARLTKEIGIAGVSPHDLRRTVGTELARLGLPSHIRALILNHSSHNRSVTDAVYNRYAYDSEKREALQLWENKLGAILQTRDREQCKLPLFELADCP
jgi:integrase